MKGRLPAALAAAILLLGALALWAVTRIGGGETRFVPPPDQPVEALPTPPAIPAAAPPLTAPPEPTDAETLRRRALLEEARARYRSLRESYDAARPSADSRARLAPALRTVARGDAIRWQSSCRGNVCRVDAPAPSAWQGPLRQSESIRAIAERVEVDPDGAESAAFLLLSEGSSADSDAASGDGALRQVELLLRSSAEVRKCLESSPQRGTLQYELQVDSAGITYRVDGNLPREVIDCLTTPMTDAITATAVSPSVTTATRVFTLGTP